MSTMHCFTSESVSEGHPDKVCDQISDAILDSCILSDPDSRVACECLATTDFLVISGEISSKASPDFEKIARKVINDIGYNSPELGFDGNTAKINVRLHAQSRDIARGVDSATSQDHEQGAKPPPVSFQAAPGQTVQKPMSPQMAQCGERSRRRSDRSRLNCGEVFQMRERGASRTSPQSQGKELQGRTLPNGVTQSVVHPAWQIGESGTSDSWPASVPVGNGGSEARKAAYSLSSSIIASRDDPEWPGTRMFAGWTGKWSLSPSFLAAKKSSMCSWKSGVLA